MNRKDTKWKTAAKEWLACHDRLEKAKKGEAAARAVLVKLAPNGAEGAGVRLVRVDEVGRISYAAAIANLCPDADLTPYRGEPYTYYKVCSIAATIKERKK